MLGAGGFATTLGYVRTTCTQILHQCLHCTAIGLEFLGTRVELTAQYAHIVSL